MKKSVILFALAISTSGFAQTTAVPLPAPQATVTVAPITSVAGPDANTRIVRGGAQIRVRFLHNITTEDRAAHVGDRVRMEVAEDVVSDGVTIIPHGTPVTAELTGVRNKGMWGRSGRLEGRVLNMSLNGRTVRMSGAFDDRGVTGTAGVVAALAVVPIAGFFVTGTSANIPAGGEISAYIDEDVAFALTTAAPVEPVAVEMQAVEVAPAVATAP